LKKILFVSGSIGLGHVGRDLEIVRALRKLRPDVEISWMAEPPASEILEKAGEMLLPEANLLYPSNSELEEASKSYKANLVQWVMNMRKGWSQNAKVYEKISEAYGFDLWVGDETYDILVAMVNNPSLKKCPFAIIYDMLGLDVVTRNPVDYLVAYMTNRLWVKFLRSEPPLADRSIFIGEIQDIVDKKFGLMMPNRRSLAEKQFNFVGYVLPEDIEQYRDKTESRRFLGYSDAPLVVCSIGGTAVGKDLLDLCVAAYPIVKKRIPDLQMILVCGPRLSPRSIQVPEGVNVFGYVPNLYRHLGAADLCIVSGGGTITLELTALQRPYLYFPLEGHFEQEIDVANRSERQRAGIRMTYSKTTPESLAKMILSSIDKKVDFASISIDGAKNTARIINQILS
jgi:UDP-N-acetylglucosamine:LPS N-acetylglucosamine transferase